jgi:NADH:ubiquinone oxidoreductase subunit E
MNEASQQTNLEEQLFAHFTNTLEAYRGKPGALIPALQTAQNVFGYIPKPAMKLISHTLDEPISRVLGVVTFYSFFSTVPRGKYVIRVCLGTACYVGGGQHVIDSLKEALNIEVDQTTEDKMFSLEVARCFGACGLAPILMVNEEVHPHVNPAKIDDILALYRNREREESPRK